MSREIRHGMALPRPALLASVASLAELDIAAAGGADIIDLKDPAAGALGAWPLRAVAQASARVGGRLPLSATVGDRPMERETVTAAVAETAAAGADIVKVGLFRGDRPACIEALAALAARGIRIVAVVFADQDPDPSLLPLLREKGFAGVMLDTADKTRGSLRALLPDRETAAFVAAARRERLMVGLAGSLALADARPLAALGPDFLGFRRALCGAAGRTAAIDPAALAAVRAALGPGLPPHLALARHATATAGAQLPAQ